MPARRPGAPPGSTPDLPRSGWQRCSAGSPPPIPDGLRRSRRAARSRRLVQFVSALRLSFGDPSILLRGLAISLSTPPPPPPPPPLLSATPPYPPPPLPLPLIEGTSLSLQPFQGEGQ